MGRPREHDLDVLLDHARALWVEKGTTGLTIRALSAQSGVSTGAIYNAFGSRENLLARAWVREGRTFLAFQRALVDAALSADDVEGAVLAASGALADYSETHEEAARLLLAVDVRDVLAFDLDPPTRAEVFDLHADLSATIVRLSGLLWGRTDPVATTLLTVCVVDLPSKLLFTGGPVASTLGRHALGAAVRGITRVEPPPPSTEEAR